MDQKRSREIVRMLDEISEKLRAITEELGKPVHLYTHINSEGKGATTIYALGYRKDHYFDGCERISYGKYTVDPEQVVFGAEPIGLETELMLREMRRRQN